MNDRRPLLIAMVFALCAIACAQLGVQPLDRAPQTVQESLLIASESGKGFTQTFTQLRAGNLIAKSSYDNVIADLQTAHDTVQSGLNLYAAGHYSEAMSALDKAELTLHTVAALLARINNGEAQ